MPMSPDATPTHAQHSRPLWLAALLTPFALPIAYALIFMLGNAARGRELMSEEATRALSALVIFGLPISLVATFLLGLPFALLLRSKGWLNMPVVCGAAVIAGIVAFHVFMLTLGGMAKVGILEIAISGTIGLFMGIVFCLIAGVRFRRAAAT
jgi:site-specific recombinase